MRSEVEHEATVQRTRHAILSLVRQRGPGIKLPTVLEMCAQFRVTRTQLEQALVQVERAGLLNRRRGSGIYGTARASQQTIGVVFGGDIFSPPFSPCWSLLLQAAREQVGDRGLVPRAYLDMAVGDGPLGGHAQLVEDLEACRLDGLLLLSPRHHGQEVAALRVYGVPVVVFGGKAPADWVVELDWAAFFGLAAQAVAATRCRRLGLLAVPDLRQDLAGAFRAAGRRVPRLDDWSYATWARAIPGAGTHEDCARRLVERLLAGGATPPLPDTLISLEDTMTRGVLTALHQAGLRPGRDLRIITAENQGSPVLAPYAAELTRIVFDPRDCMQAALGMLATLMTGGTPARSPLLIAPQLHQPQQAVTRRTP